MRLICWPLSVVVMVGCLAGCSSEKRPVKTQQALLEHREANAKSLAALQTTYMDRLIARAKAKQDENIAKKIDQPTTIDLLVISGGGDWGAFGAGFLKGWGTVTGDMARPKFDAVTGVSTGALIAPFAFLGDDPAINMIESIYRNPNKDWVKKRGTFYFMPHYESFATIPGLERELRDRMTDSMIHRMAAEHQAGRALLVNTTDLDDGDMWVWDVGQECQNVVNGGPRDRVMDILLASAGIPAAFPFRIIDGTMYVDGGITGNILYGGRTKEDQSFHATWKRLYPDRPMPKIRYWVIFNNQIVPPPQVTERNWPAVLSRATVMGTRSATLTSLRHLKTQAELWKLKYGADIEVRIAAVPDGWEPPVQGVFNKEVMNALTDIGEKMGADPKAWNTDPF